MRSSQYEEEYDDLFNADNRSEEASEMSAKELDETIKGRFMLGEQDIIREWYYRRWISYKEYLRLTGLAF